MKELSKWHCICCREVKDDDPEKWAGSNWIDNTAASGELHATICTSAQSPDAAHSSTDADCWQKVASQGQLNTSLKKHDFYIYLF